MRILRDGLLIGAVAAVVCAGTAQAAPSKANIVATHTYLLAKYRLERAGENDLSSGLRLAREYGERFEQECAGVLTNAPKLTIEHPSPNSSALGPRSTLEFFIEALGTVFDLLAKPTTSATLHFARQVQHLRWTDHKLTSLVHLDARQDEREAKEPTPDLCADAKFWASTGFREVSPATRRYRQAHESTNSEEDEGTIGGLTPPGGVAQRLKRYEDPADRVLARRLKALERQILTKLRKAAAASRVTPQGG